MDPQAKHYLALGRETLVGKHSDETFLGVGHQLTQLKRDSGLVFFLENESLNLSSLGVRVSSSLYQKFVTGEASWMRDKTSPRNFKIIPQ